MERPRPHQSPCSLPQQRSLQAGARTVTLETRTVFVTITCPLPRTIPHPRPTCRTRRLPQARPSTESGTVLAWPLGPSAWTPRIPQQFPEFVEGEAKVIWPGPPSPEGASLRTILAPRACPCLPFFSSFSWVPLRPQTAMSRERVQGGPARHQGGESSPQEPGRAPFSAATSRLGGVQAPCPHRQWYKPPHPQPIYLVRPRFKLLGGKVLPLLDPPAPTHMHSSKLQARGSPPRPGATVLGEFGSPSPRPCHGPGSKLGQGGCRGAQGSKQVLTGQ